MELNNSITRAKSALPAKPSREPWALALRACYGDDSQMLRAWSADKRDYCLANIAGAAQSPTVVRMLKSYPEAWPVAVSNAVAATLVETTDAEAAPTAPADITRMVGKLLSDDRLRTLPAGILWAFFARLGARRYTIYGKHATPGRMLDTLQREYPNLRAEVQRVQAEAESRDKAAREARHKADAMNWAEYAQSRGLDPGNNPLDKFNPSNATRYDND